MLHDAVEDPGAQSPETLHAEYLAALRSVVEASGVASVAEASGVAESTLEALAEGETPELTLEEAAAIVAVDIDGEDGASVAATARDALLIGMTTAVLDVEAVESGLNGTLEAREIQSKLEGRFPMTLAEYARLQAFIEGHT